MILLICVKMNFSEKSLISVTVFFLVESDTLFFIRYIKIRWFSEDLMFSSFTRDIWWRFFPIHEYIKFLGMDFSSLIERFLLDDWQRKIHDVCFNSHLESFLHIKNFKWLVKKRILVRFEIHMSIVHFRRCSSYIEMNCFFSVYVFLEQIFIRKDFRSWSRSQRFDISWCRNSFVCDDI